MSGGQHQERFASFNDRRADWKCQSTLHQWPQPSDPPFSPFFLRFTAANAGVVEVVDVDQSGQTVDNCVFEYRVGVNEAAVRPGQQCHNSSIDETISYPNDVFVLSADKATLD